MYKDKQESIASDTVTTDITVHKNTLRIESLLALSAMSVYFQPTCYAVLILAHMLAKRKVSTHNSLCVTQRTNSTYSGIVFGSFAPQCAT